MFDALTPTFYIVALIAASQAEYLIVCVAEALCAQWVAILFKGSLRAAADKEHCRLHAK